MHGALNRSSHQDKEERIARCVVLPIGMGAGQQGDAAIGDRLQPKDPPERHGQDYLKFTQKRVKSRAGMLDLFFALKNRLTTVDKSVLTGMNLV